jgi:hypothetical protein
MYQITAWQTNYIPDSYGDGNPQVEYDEKVIATFDTKAQALKYIKDSKLKKKKQCSWSDGYPFRSSSLLSRYAYAEVEEYEPYDPPPHNPTL